MKNKIVLFSTRDISEKNTIFQNVSVVTDDKGCLNSSLFEYLKSEIKIPKGNPDIMNKEAIWKKIEDSFSDDLWKKRDDSENVSNLENALNKRESTRVSFYVKRIEKEGISIFSNEEERNTFNKLINEVKEASDFIPTDELKLDDVISYLKSPTDKKKEKEKKETLEGRLSLYHVDLENDSEYENVGIYAVKPLENPDCDCDEDAYKGEKLKRRWINALIAALSPFSNNEADIYLMLHDKDLKSTYKEPMQFVWRKPLSGKNVSLCVFQHPEDEYKLLKKVEGGITAQSLFSKIENLFEELFLEKVIKELSELISSQWDDDKSPEEFRKHMKTDSNLEKLLSYLEVLSNPDAKTQDIGVFLQLVNYEIQKIIEKKDNCDGKQ